MYVNVAMFSEWLQIFAAEYSTVTAKKGRGWVVNIGN